MKKIRLTIDDSPTEDTGYYLDVLKKFGLKATFFIIGNNAEKNLPILYRMAKEGHWMGNHTFNHERFSRSNLILSLYGVFKTHRIIKKIYKKTGRKEEIEFRFPFMDSGYKAGEITQGNKFRQMVIRFFIERIMKCKISSAYHDIMDWKLRYDDISEDEIFHNMENLSSETVLIHDEAYTKVVFEELVRRLDKKYSIQQN